MTRSVLSRDLFAPVTMIAGTGLVGKTIKGMVLLFMVGDDSTLTELAFNFIVVKSRINCAFFIAAITLPV